MLSFKEFLRARERWEQDEPLPHEPQEIPLTPMESVYQMYLEGKIAVRGTPK